MDTTKPEFLEDIEDEELKEYQKILPDILSAVEEKEYAKVRTLLETIPKSKRPNSEHYNLWRGKTASCLLMAIRDPDFPLYTIELFIQRGCPADCDENGETHDRFWSYHHAVVECVASNNMNALNLMLAYNRPCHYDLSDALSYAIRHGKLDFVKLLISLETFQALGVKGEYPNKRVEYGMAPITTTFKWGNAILNARKQGYEKLEKFLLEYINREETTTI